MKPSLIFISFLLAGGTGFTAAEKAGPRLEAVILDVNRVKGLRIQTAVAEPATFESTFFSLGQVQTKPGTAAAISSTISGRLTRLDVTLGDKVLEGATVASVESRQPGNPPPVIPLKARITGHVTRVDIRPGDPVEPDRALLEITPLEELLVVAHVPEHLVASIPENALARIHIPALGKNPVEGRLLRFAIQANPENGTWDAQFVIPNPGYRIRPGLRAEVSIVTAQRTDVISLPRSAVQGDATARFVFVKDFQIPHAFVKAPVTVGEINDQQVEITSGLLAGDEVVVQGGYALSFAGGSSLSLKEALDAAHGHEHAADGSELSTTKGKSATPKDRASPASDAHDHGHEHPGHERFWMILSFVLMGALAYVWKRGRNVSQTPAESPTSKGR